MIEITAFKNMTEPQRREARDILMRALVPWDAYQEVAEAQAELAMFFESPERVALAGLESGRLRGWIGAIRIYDYGWELHPLVVDPEHQGRGIGTQLVEALEQRARSENVVTLILEPTTCSPAPRPAASISTPISPRACAISRSPRVTRSASTANWASAWLEYSRT